MLVWKRFLEKYSFLPKYHRKTKRLAYYVIHLLRNTFSLKQVAELSGVSVQTVCRLIDTLKYEIPSVLPHTLSIDEFKGNAITGKYQCILVDPKKRKILDILPDRTQSHLADYFRKIPRSQRLKVRFFVCDMWQPYVEMAKTFSLMQQSSLINTILFAKSPRPLKMSEKDFSAICL